MAYWCIDPVDGDDGTGSSQATQALAEASAFKTWAAVTWAAGDTYLQKRETVATETVTLTTFGTSVNPITIGAYGSGAKPVIDAENVRAVCLQRGGAEYIIIEDIVVRNSTGVGISLRQSALRDCSGTVIRRCEAYDCANIGFYWVFVSGSTSLGQATGVLCEDSIANNCGRHGISINIGYDGAIIRRCKASGNAITDNGWGIYMAPAIGKWNSSDWTNITNVDIATDIWQRASLGLQATETQVTVVADGRTNAAETTAEYWLTEGTFGALSPNEWARVGANTQVVIGQDPNNKAISYANAIGDNGVIEFCEVTNHGNAGGGGDGVGIGFDHASQNSSIRHCLVDCNGDGGVGYSFNISNDNEIINSTALNASVYGFRINTPSPGTVNKVTNCAAIDCATDTFYVRFLNANRILEADLKNPEASEISSSYELNKNAINLIAQGKNANFPEPFPASLNGEPVPSFDIDIGPNHSTFGPFHTKNL